MFIIYVNYNTSVLYDRVVFTLTIYFRFQIENNDKTVISLSECRVRGLVIFFSFEAK